MDLTITIACLLAPWGCSAHFPDPATQVPEQKFVYLRRTAKGVVPESVFTVRRDSKGWSIASKTGSDDAALIVRAEYDVHDHLVRAEVRQAKDSKIGRVEVSGASALVQAGGKEYKFEVPPGVIVTSAPDWSDAFLLCRRYDRKKGDQQRFPGLWLHPEKGAFQLTFTVEHKGDEIVKLGDKQQKLERVLLRLRNNSEYTAWVDVRGAMIRLQPGAQADPPYELLLQGHEK